MPRSDGSLYNFEREKLFPKAPKVAAKSAGKSSVKNKVEGKVSDKATAPDVPDNVLRYPNGRKVHPLHPSVYFGDSPIAKNGRPARVIITPQLVQGILNDIRNGLSIEAGLILAGIHRTSVEKWRKSNPSLDAQFVKAEYEWEKGIVGNLQRMAQADIRANTFLLERKAPARWAPVSKTELTGKDGGPVQNVSLHKTLLATVSMGSDSSERPRKPKQVEVVA